MYVISESQTSTMKKVISNSKKKKLQKIVRKAESMRKKLYLHDLDDLNEINQDESLNEEYSQVINKQDVDHFVWQIPRTM